ncbi:hypothetical protein J7K50_02220 [bacterium]|nr:hypothetical protein [bacterium]
MRLARNEALMKAHRLLSMICDACEKYEIAGSIRRKRSTVGDAEIVAIPYFDHEKVPRGLFGAPEPIKINLLWRRLDNLIEQGDLMKARYLDKNGRESRRWGEIYRGVSLPDDSFKFEIFTADHENWGLILMIRTGSAGFSRGFVTHLLRKTDLRAHQGRLVRVFPHAGEKKSSELLACDIVETVPVRSEHSLFELAGLVFRYPEFRDNAESIVPEREGERCLN